MSVNSFISNLLIDLISDVESVGNVTLLLVEASSLRFAEIVHADLHTAVSEGSESGFRAHGFDISTGKLVFAHDEFFKVAVSIHVHLGSVNGENLALGLLIGERELDLAINTTRSDKGGVKRLNSVSSHDHLNVRSGIETIKLIEELEHGSLDFLLTT
jgi:hypothetical protein